MDKERNEKTISKKRILTGMRPSGALHLGHYVGALENWLHLQNEYECYFLIADYQALGDHIDDIERIRKSVIDVTVDWLSVGLNPVDTTFIIQSYIPEYAELFMLLSMITPLSLIDKNPTLKSEIEQLKKDVTLGFYNYPASQIADILLSKAHLVPTGEDQVPHIELTRVIARKFNRLYGETFPEPEVLIGRFPRLVGTDGKAKMSKSLGNCIFLSDSEEIVNKKVMKMYTDPTRKSATDPGHVENNPVFIYLDAFHKDKEELISLKRQYEQGKIGDVLVKKLLATTLNDFLKPIREKSEYYRNNPLLVKQAIIEGTIKAKKMAENTMYDVRNAIRITNYENLLMK